MTEIVNSLAEISHRYDAVFCDLWGCLHNGRAAFPSAVKALQDFRAKGGTVVLLTNAPRPRKSVAVQLQNIGVPQDCWDIITTSGDSARYAMFQGVVGQKVYFIGYEKDLIFFEPLKIAENSVEITRVPLQEAEGTPRKRIAADCPPGVKSAPGVSAAVSVKSKMLSSDNSCLPRTAIEIGTSWRLSLRNCAVTTTSSNNKF